MSTNIGLYSYGFACLSYLLLAGALLLIWRNRSLSITALLATVITVVWAGITAASTVSSIAPFALVQLAEVARNMAWIFLLLAIYGERLRGSSHLMRSRRWIPWALVGLAVVVILLFATPRIGAIFDLSPILIAACVYGIWITISIAALLLLENVYRNSTNVERWWARYLCLGIGFLFLYDFMMYADALIFVDVDPVLWRSRGFAVALAAPLVAIAAARSSDNRHSREKLSRHVVFHTFSLLLAGIYLILMAVIGYFVNYLGGSWGGVLQVFFLSATGLFLVVLLFSNRVRALSRVWLSKNFFSYKYDYRLEWLEFTKTLEEEEGGDTPQAIIRAMAKLSHCRAGLLWSRVEGGNFQLESQWLSDISEPIVEAPEFVSWLEESGWIVDVQEWRVSPQLYSGLKMPAPLAEAEGSWMVVPLLFGAHLEGILIMRRTASYIPLNWEDRDLLKVAGRQAAIHLAQYHASQSLVELRQFEAFSRLSAYVVHDLKNILAEQSLIVSNAARHRGNLVFFDDVIATVGDSVERMTRLMAQISGEVRGGKIESIELGGLLRELLKSRKLTVPKPELDVLGGPHWVRADREQLATVFGHIIQNAGEATHKNGKVSVRLLAEGKHAVVEIEDDGVGMTEDFIKGRLFKPFESTKGLTGMGIGAFESRELVRKLGGNIYVSSTEGVGSCFRIVLPSLRPEIEESPAPEGVADG